MFSVFQGILLYYVITYYCISNNTFRCQRQFCQFVDICDSDLICPCFIFSQYLPAATKLGQGNIFTSVCLSTVGGKGCLPRCMLGYPPPRSRSPPDRAHTHPPGSRHPPGADTPPQTRHPPEQTPPRSRHPLDQTPPNQAHPPRSRLQHTVNERPVRILLECILVFF